MNNVQIDITFDMRTDSNGKDPDSASKTLKTYHKILWSKRLPNGNEFILNNNVSGAYLYHNSFLGEYWLSSDSVIHTYRYWKKTQEIIKQVSEEEMDYFYHLAYTIGGMMIFPGNRINGMHTMNQERGMNTYINDRMDITLECIKRFYNDEKSPIYDTIKRYETYFNLFDTFKGYCDYFLLQDMVTENYENVKFFLPFDGFIKNPLPKNIIEYELYKNNNIEFLHKRNKRIKDYCEKNI